MAKILFTVLAGLGVMTALGLWPLWLAILLFILSALSFIVPLALAALVAYGVWVGAPFKDYVFLWKTILLQIQSSSLIGKNRLITDLWYSTYATSDQDKTAMIFVDTGAKWTFGDLERRSNQVARIFYSSGYRAGDVVALLSENCPEYVAMWLGLAKIGVRTALINSNIRKKQLQHCIQVSDCKALIFAHTLRDAVADVIEDINIPVDARFVMNGGKDTSKLGVSLDTLLSKTSDDQIKPTWSAHAQGVMVKDPILFVYTSGTTGLPKAAKITHWRLGFAPIAFGKYLGIYSNDIIYCSLPMYHSAATFLGISQLFYRGATVVIRKKFSASKFWLDCRTYDVTVVQYIGELCRYLLSVPKHSLDATNKVRLAMGNGLRPDIWIEFRDRFGIKQIGEFYAATEGAAGLLNFDNKDFAIGYMPALTRAVAPMGLIKFDVENEEPVRDKDGKVVRCKPGETGEFICKVLNFKNGVSNFSGYTNKAATDKKVLHNVFKQGDAWFRSGDLIRMDKDGYCYFVDRIGDTFRWKGENCATSEIAEVVSTFPAMPTGTEVNVYGVQIEGKDGRAGMAALSGSNVDQVDLAALAKHITANLVTYARPIFIRLTPEMEITSTFKHKKVELRNEGFDPTSIKDPIYFLQDGSYVRLTAALHKGILTGDVRV